ncbi:ATPase family AAA domain-containing protein 2-like [Apis laboriosa]|uniref:ATPase family AAA domain-containing protein 2-like n=1 Tax=Apis laboriosa TaxID=183418 RepID=UPI001CC6FE29|nr:ATPase family AAA domain-containing protein 2-like [Apis laboriosa]
MSCTKDFSCIGGLEKHIRIVKETVLFPLIYGDIYAKFNLKPPRGLLFYGPPGTGKTLVASALAVECSNAERKVSFISRKGSDCLSKWVGESEKKLQKIFFLAQQSKPCIIFFDEVDGLAPVRSSRQDFVHASIVSTLLALMDGLENNSEIIVIGATNRIDAIDPALRRPGRFDRELYFPLPCYTARKEILSVHIKSWKQKPPQKFLAYLASKTVGFCGSDLQALCAEAVMCCVRRNYPEIYTSKAKYQINERHLKVEKQDFLKAQQNILPASHRVSIAPIKSLSYKIQPLLQDNLSYILSQLEILCPIGMLTCNVITGKAASRSNSCPRILLCGDDDSHTRHLGPALLHSLEHLPCHLLDITTLFEETGKAAEEALIQKMKMARRNLPSLIYIPDILTWWDLVDEAARIVFTSLMQSLDRSVNMLIMVTANCSRKDLPADIVSLFDEYQGEIFEVISPREQHRELFFKQLFVHSACDFESNSSSQVDFEQIMNSRKTKEVGRKRKLTGRTDIMENPLAQEMVSFRRSKLRARNKPCSVRSAHVMINSKTKINLKRKNSASGEGPSSKRIRNSPLNLSTSSNEKLTDFQMEQLLRKIVQVTESWPCHELESLFSFLELTINMEKNEENLCLTIEECLSQFSKLRNVKVHVKKEKND